MNGGSWMKVVLANKVPAGVGSSRDSPMLKSVIWNRRKGVEHDGEEVSYLEVPLGSYL